MEISPKTNPPVCKVMDYGKYKFESQKKANQAKKKQKTIAIKEIKLRPNIDVHDYQVKMRSVQKFLSEGDSIERVYSLDNLQDDEMDEFIDGKKWMELN